MDCALANNSGSLTSTVATLAVLVPPSITTQPTSQVATAGTDVVFAVAATGTAPLSYQWRFGIPGSGGGNIPGATNATLTVTNVQPTNAGNYRVTVSNAAGSATSLVATLTVNVPPTISAEPQSATVPAGSNVTFNVTASGTAPLSYQWRFNGTNIVGAMATNYTVTNVQASNSGPYTVVITNVAGSITSAPARLTLVSELRLQYQIFTTNGTLGWRVGPTVDQPYLLESSANLTNWTSVFTNSSGASSSNFIQAPITNTPYRFLRGKRWP